MIAFCSPAKAVKGVSLPRFVKVLHLCHLACHFLLACLVPKCTGRWAAPGCQLDSTEVTGVSRPGDILIGGIFPLHVDKVSSQTTFEAEPQMITCRTFVFQNYQWLQAMVFAIEEINRNPNLLPNITLGFLIYDSCADPQRALHGTLWMLTGQERHTVNYRCYSGGPLAGIVGDGGSKGSIPIARVLGLYRYPQISYFSTTPLLSDRNQFPSFFRTIPSDIFQFHGLAQLVIHFNWTWVGILAADDDYGQTGVQILKVELHNAGVCIAFSENIILSDSDRNAYHIVQVIKNSTANAIVIFALDSHLVPILNEILRQNITGRIFIASEAWSTSPLLSVEKYLKILSGTIGFAIHSKDMPGFKEYFSSVHPLRFSNDLLLQEFWEAAFGCKWQGPEIPTGCCNITTNLCTGAEKLDTVDGFYNDVTSPRVSFNAYRAVYAISVALHVLNSCSLREGPFNQGTCANILDFHCWQLLPYVQNVHFWDDFERKAFFDTSGNPLAQYDIVNWQLQTDGTVMHRTVGRYDLSAPGGNRLLINTTAIRWAASAEVPISICSPSCSPGFRKTAKEGEPDCCFLCVPCAEGEIANKTDSVECTECPWDKWPNLKHDRCSMKPIMFLSYKEPLGTITAAVAIIFSLTCVSILGLFVHSKKTPIVKANNRTLSYLLLLSLMLCFLCSFAFIGYPTTEKCLLRQVAFGITFALCVSCILAKTIMVVIAFNATKPNSNLRKLVGPNASYTAISVGTIMQVLLCLFWLIFFPPFPEYNAHTQPETIIVECNEGSPIAFWCMLGYLGLLATICLIVAFLARNLPNSFNEAKYITFSMLSFLSVWLSFVPAYLSTRGKYMVAMEIFAILSSSSSLVACIFFPKCYIILLRPEKNTKDFLMGRYPCKRKTIK